MILYIHNASKDSLMETLTHHKLKCSGEREKGIFKDTYSLFIIWGKLLSGEPDYFGRNKISSGGDLSHYSSASLY